MTDDIWSGTKIARYNIENGLRRIVDVRGRGAGKSHKAAMFALERAQRPGARVHYVTDQGGDTALKIFDAAFAIGIFDKRTTVGPDYYNYWLKDGAIPLSVSTKSGDPDMVRGAQYSAVVMDGVESRYGRGGYSLAYHMLLASRLGENPAVYICDDKVSSNVQTVLSNLGGVDLSAVRVTIGCSL